MHVPSIRQSATVGIVFCAILAVAAPVATPVDLGADVVDIVKRVPEPFPSNVDNISSFNDPIVTRDELEKRRDRNNKCRRGKDRGKKGCNYDDDYENYRGKGGNNDLNKRDGGGDGDNQNNGAWDDMLNKDGYGGGHGGGGGGGWGGGGWGGGGCKGGKKCGGGGWGDGGNDNRNGGRKGGKKGPWRGDESPENVDD